MDTIYETNYIRLCGRQAAAPVYSHTGRGREFYSFPLEVRRLSGNRDTLNILIGREQLAALEAAGERVCITGQLRSWNNRRGEGAKLVITMLAREICPAGDEPDENLVQLRGTICKAPKLRQTPMGRDICDLMLAVNRHYGRSDYLPCICWGLKAKEAALWNVGSLIDLEGRLQSRTYIKLTEDGPMERVAFEVSATDVSIVS